MLPLKKKEVDTIGLRPSGLLKKKSNKAAAVLCFCLYYYIHLCLFKVLSICLKHLSFGKEVFLSLKMHCTYMPSWSADQMKSAKFSGAASNQVFLK